MINVWLTSPIAQHQMTECKAQHNVKLLWRWLFQMGSHYRHRSANNWSAVNDSFKWGVSSSEGTPHLKTWPNSSGHFEGALTEDIDQAILDLLSLTVSCVGGGYFLISAFTSSEKMSSLRNLLLLHWGLFYERPINSNEIYLACYFIHGK